MRKYIFFTLNNFSQDDGGTLRMRGIINALAESDVSVTLISNTTLNNKFHHSVNHVFLDYYTTKRYKQFLQLSLAIFPISLQRYYFGDILNRIDKVFEIHNIDRTSIVFFEYLDNSIGYLLKQNELIQNYINDVHGIAPLEFELKKISRPIEWFENYIKLKMVQRLDKKVITNAKSLLFVSSAMKEYFEIFYPAIRKFDNKVLRDGTSRELCSQKINTKHVESLRIKYNISPNEKVVLFLGDFKDLGGVMDLIESFSLLSKRKKTSDIKLLLVGNGERFVDAVQIVKKYGLGEKVIIAGRILYTEVRDYQELSDIIVCSDRQHQFSELIPHIKYFDSLVSGKVVINGSFKSIREINIDEKYSVDFHPSDIVDLADKIEYAFENMDYLKSKYRDNPRIVCQNFSYHNSVQVLLN